MTLDEAREVIKNAKPIEPIKRSSTLKLSDEQENNTFTEIMRKWKKK